MHDAEPTAANLSAPAPPLHSPLQRASLHLYVGWAYVMQALKTRLTYRGDFLAQLVASVLAELVGLAVAWILFTKVDELQDVLGHSWTAAQVFFIYGFSMIPRALFNFVAYSFYRFSGLYLVEGQFDRVLLRPLNSLFQVLLEAVDFNAFGDLVLGGVILVMSWQAMGAPAYPLWHLGLFVLMVLSATGVLLGIFLALTAVSFWATDRIGILPPVYNLMSFARYPLTIYRPWVRFGLSFILPFGFAAFYPATFFLPGADRAEFLIEFCLTPLVGLGVLFFGYWIWSLGVRRYESTGT